MLIRQIFRIGTVRYAEGLWRMHRHGPVIAHCTDSEDFPLILTLTLMMTLTFPEPDAPSKSNDIIPSQFSTLMSRLWWYSTGHVIHDAVSIWKILQVPLLSLLPVQDITMMFHKDVYIAWFSPWMFSPCWNRVRFRQHQKNNNKPDARPEPNPNLA